MKGAMFDTEWWMVLLHGLAPDKFMNEKAILVGHPMYLCCYTISTVWRQDKVGK